MSAEGRGTGRERPRPVVMNGGAFPADRRKWASGRQRFHASARRPGRNFPAFPVFGRRGRSGSGGEREEEPGKCRRRAEGLVGRGRGPVVMDGRGAVGRRPGGEQARRHARTKGGFRRAFPVFVGAPVVRQKFFCSGAERNASFSDRVVDFVCRCGYHARQHAASACKKRPFPFPLRGTAVPSGERRRIFGAEALRDTGIVCTAVSAYREGRFVMRSVFSPVPCPCGSTL